MADDPTSAVPLKVEHRPAEPLQQAKGLEEARSYSVPADRVARNGGNVTLVEEEPSRIKIPSSADEEGVSS